ncbi:isopentenyl-diphosphate delta-isomerase [Salirhabdus euzebyi]|uniref:Isopentenyl-diphosphate delta-isomerase n=1 Tax=Salirhabdus euzebyi TaxID=394506 RepID=A0A841Q1S8_9BACI|nr:type 2 isopentenyl-diphosphate Delta-isomerase [Salirhabdus euzebyi]MBB6452192.1 isopentenyl-diphosphate delta-isomerase [Salirhabdus euzebyi]
MNRSQRKLAHIREAVDQQFPRINSFDEMEIIHQSLTPLNWDQLSLKVDCGELSLSSPLFVNAMTGGGGMPTEEINKQIAFAAYQTGIAMAVGSQTSALKDEKEKRTYEVIRNENPSGVVFANVGSEVTVDQALTVIDMIEANALQIHLNTMQELIMPEGDRDFSSRLSKIENMVKNVNVPIILKEVGFGISKETALQLKNIGVKYIDVGGKGGTSFSSIENRRREKPMAVFDNWGIPTTLSLKEVKTAFPACHLIASGGIRDGLDGAKSIVLGAKMFGMAGPLLKTLVQEGQDELIQKIHHIHDELKVAMLALGAKKVGDLKGSPHVFYGKSKEWIDQRKLNLN